MSSSICINLPFHRVTMGASPCASIIFQINIQKQQFSSFISVFQHRCWRIPSCSVILKRLWKFSRQILPVNTQKFFQLSCLLDCLFKCDCSSSLFRSSPIRKLSVFCSSALFKIERGHFFHRVLVCLKQYSRIPTVLVKLPAEYESSNFANLTQWGLYISKNTLTISSRWSSSTRSSLPNVFLTPRANSACSRV